MDCTGFEIFSDRYVYATEGYIATDKQCLPSTRLHVIQEALYGVIINYNPSGGQEHESPITNFLLKETEEINV